MNEPNEAVQEAELLCVETNSLAIREADRQELINTLKPIAEAMPLAVKLADELIVTNAVQAEQAAQLRESWLNNQQLAETTVREFSNGLLARLFKVHRNGTAIIGRFNPFIEAARTVKEKIIRWHEAETEKARKEQERLQAEADEKARRERERLEKQAEKLKTPEKREERLAQAAAVIPHVVHVPPPAKAVKTSYRWVVTKLDSKKFVEAAAKDNSLVGYVTFNLTGLARAKAANPMLEVPGVTFEKKAV